MAVRACPDKDADDMDRMGKMQDLQRNFRLTAILGFAVILTSTWETQLGTAAFGLQNGGTAGLIYGYLVVSLGFALVTLSLAEMASMAPTAGGQYHWVSEFAPPSVQKVFSYIIGWLCVLGWQAGCASSSFLTATVIQGLVVLNRPDYDPMRWHGACITVAVSLLCFCFNAFLAKRLPLVEGFVLVLHIAGFFAIMIPLWVLGPRSDVKAVFTHFNNGGDWISTAGSCMVGLITAVVSLLGADAPTHMSEEVKHASKTLPRAMLLSFVINGLLGWVMLVTFCFVIGDVDAILATPTGYPFIAVFFNATQSLAGTTAMVAIMITLSLFCAMMNMATASRQLFAFARDKGTPYGMFFATVQTNTPLRSIAFTTVITCLLSMITIGSTIAFNQLVSAGLAALLSSYSISISFIALRRMRKKVLLSSDFSLGRYGLVINIASIVFLVIVFVLSFFPQKTHPAPAEMNFSIVIYGGVVILSGLYYWFKGKSVYAGPVKAVRNRCS